MNTNEEFPVISDVNSMDGIAHLHDPSVKKIRRGRPKKQNDLEPVQVQSSSNIEQPRAQEVFSFSPESEPSKSPVEQTIDSSNDKNNESQAHSEKSEDRPKFPNKRPDFQHKHRHQHHQHNPQQRHGQHQHHSNRHQHQNQNQQKHQHQQQQPKKQQLQHPPKAKIKSTAVDLGGLIIGNLPNFELFKDKTALASLANEISQNTLPIYFNELYELPLQGLAEKLTEMGIVHDRVPHRRTLLLQVLNWAKEQKRPIIVKGVVENLDANGLVVYANNNYAIKELSTFIPESILKEYGLLRGHEVEFQIHPPREGETCPFAVKLLKVMDTDPAEVAHKVPFEDLIPYYPTRRLLLETNSDATWDNFSMRIVDILTPIGLGQRGLIVAPPRTGKTMLLQGIAHAIAVNKPDAQLIVLLIDERPEEVTDFRRQVKGEVVSSTFDESALSHVHVAEMVIERARRLVEYGKDVIILLDSITRLARAYNTMMPSSGKILSGGVEANALQKPKRFFGSARNIENGGSLTILGTALIDTGSRMDEVIFEEFKGTGNMELHLDRELVSKRIFPALSMDRSGTRKEELIYHPDEMEKVYSLRRAMKGIPPLEAMEMFIQRIKKTKSNTEFLLGLNR